MFCKATKETANSTALTVAIKQDLITKEDTQDPE